MNHQPILDQLKDLLGVLSYGEIVPTIRELFNALAEAREELKKVHREMAALSNATDKLAKEKYRLECENEQKETE